ncbi:expansin family protein [Pyronema omphalodes]|nr:expansin family protein [Pyronema omphalodes]
MQFPLLTSTLLALTAITSAVPTNLPRWEWKAPSLPPPPSEWKVPPPSQWLPKPAAASTGEATYYTPGLGACGGVNSPTDLIAAVAVGRGKGECGKKVKITRGSKSVEVTIADLCEGCAWGDLDLTIAGFTAIAEVAEGRVKIGWSYV